MAKVNFPSSPSEGQIETVNGTDWIFSDGAWKTVGETSVAFDSDFSTKTTDDLPEGSTNLYYTDSRVRNAISATGDISYNSSTGVFSYTETGTNLGVIPGTNNGPTITSSTGSNVQLPVATESNSGVMTTDDQDFSGVKTFERIHLKSPNTYSGWANPARMFIAYTSNGVRLFLAPELNGAVDYGDEFGYNYDSDVKAWYFDQPPIINPQNPDDTVLYNNQSANVTLNGDITLNNNNAQLLVPDGTATNPSIAFKDDIGTNTGFYRLNENEIGIAAGNSQAARVSMTEIVAKDFALDMPKSYAFGRLGQQPSKLALTMFEQWGDHFQFANVLNVEHDSGGGYVSVPITDEYRHLFSGYPTTSLTPALGSNVDGLRITFRTKQTYPQAGIVLVYQEWTPGGPEDWTATIERSGTGAFAGEQTTLISGWEGSTYFEFNTISDHSSEDYYRITFDISGRTESIRFVNIRCFTDRVSFSQYRGLPFSWTSGGNITTEGSLVVDSDLTIEGSLVGDLTVNGEVVIDGLTQTIGNSNWDNGWLKIGDNSFGWAIDPNEIYSAAAGIIGTLAGNLQLSPATELQINSNTNVSGSLDATGSVEANRLFITAGEGFEIKDGGNRGIGNDSRVLNLRDGNPPADGGLFITSDSAVAGDAGNNIVGFGSNQVQFYQPATFRTTAHFQSNLSVGNNNINHSTGGGNWEVRLSDSATYNITRVGTLGSEFQVISDGVDYTNALVRVGGTSFGASDITNWNAAHSWGDHAAANYATVAQLSDGSVTNTSNQLTVGASIEFFTNDGGGNLGVRWNARNHPQTAAEPGSAWEFQFDNDTKNGSFTIGYDGDIDSAGEAITWTTIFRLNGSLNRAEAYGSPNVTYADATYNNDQWDDAYAWGNHATGGYYVNGSTLLRAAELRTSTMNELVINVGESHTEATGQSGEILYVNAEGGLQVNSSPDNWASSWAGRDTAIINGSGGVSSFPGDVTIHGGGDLEVVSGVIRTSNAVQNTDDSSGTSIWGGRGTGANIELYGSLHPTQSNNLYVDADITRFRSAGASSTYLTVSSSAITAGSGINFVGDVTGQVSDISNHSTTDLSEGTNLYHTTARARSAISATGDISYNSSTGVISYSGVEVPSGTEDQILRYDGSGNLVTATDASLTSAGHLSVISAGIGENLVTDAALVVRGDPYTSLADDGLIIQAGSSAGNHWTGALKLKSTGTGVPYMAIEAPNNASGSRTPTMYFDGQNTRVGIGVVQPQHPLSIQGNNPYIQLRDVDYLSSQGRFGQVNDDTLMLNNTPGKSGRIRLVFQDSSGVADRLIIGAGGDVSFRNNSNTEVVYINDNGQIRSDSYIIAGFGSGGVGLTHNDGYGNANVTFNHVSGTPEQTGNFGRIHVNTDATSNPEMTFILGNGTGGVANGGATYFRVHAGYVSANQYRDMGGDGVETVANLSSRDSDITNASSGAFSGYDTLEVNNLNSSQSDITASIGFRSVGSTGVALGRMFLANGASGRSDFAWHLRSDVHVNDAREKMRLTHQGNLTLPEGTVTADGFVASGEPADNLLQADGTTESITTLVDSAYVQARQSTFYDYGSSLPPTAGYSEGDLFLVTV